MEKDDRSKRHAERVRVEGWEKSEAREKKTKTSKHTLKREDRNEV